MCWAWSTVPFAIHAERREHHRLQREFPKAGLAKHDLRFSMLQDGFGARPVGRDTSQAGAGSLSLHEEISRAQTVDEASNAVQGALLAKVSSMFVIPETDIDPGRPLSYYGVDSLVAVELRNWLVPNARVEISIFDLIGSSSLSGLALNVVKRARPTL